MNERDVVLEVFRNRGWLSLALVSALLEDDPELRETSRQVSRLQQAGLLLRRQICGGIVLWRESAVWPRPQDPVPQRERSTLAPHARLSADVKCPRHSRWAYNVRPENCGVCQAIAAAADLANRAERELRGAARLGAELRWKGQRITESERLERVCSRLLEKAKASKGADGPLLGPPGFVSPEFADDLRELPPHLQQRIEEYAQLLEEAARTGKLGR